MTKNEKRRIHLTAEQEQRMADQAVGKVQAFANELAQVQSRRLEMMTILLQAHVTRDGLPGPDMRAGVVEAASELARVAVEHDSRQKWSDIRAMFSELKIPGPQPHLEWAARKVGVELFDKDEQPASLVLAPDVETLAKVVQ